MTNFNSHYGLEIVERAIFLRMWDWLNTAIGEAEARWAPSDQALASHLGRPYQSVLIEEIAQQKIIWTEAPPEIVDEPEVDPQVDAEAEELTEAADD